MASRQKRAGASHGSSAPPAPERSGRPHQRPALGIYASLLLVAGIVAYANSFTLPFVLDDQTAIVENVRIRDLWSAHVLSPERNSPVAGRPLANVSLAINYAAGGTAVAGYHVVNLLIHLACGLIAFGLIRRSCQLPRVPSSVATHATTIAFAAALLWLVHPLDTEAVTYITQRTTSMMALFYLLTMYASVRGWTTVAIATCALGMTCKESMVTAPVAVMLVDRVFAFTSWKDAFRARRGLYAGLAAGWIVLAALNWSGPRSLSAGFETNVGVSTYLLNQTVMITRYLWLVIWPRPLVINYGWAQPLTLAEVLPHATSIVTLLVVTAVAFRYRPQLAFFGAWVFMTLAPTSSIVPIATEVGAERRMYLPLLGIMVGAVVVTAVLGQKLMADRAESLHPAHTRLFGYGALVCVVAWLAWGTHTRNAEYASTMRLAETVLERWPSGIAHLMVGEQALRVGRRSDAIEHFRQATAKVPRAHYALGVVYFNDGRYAEAIRELATYIQKRPLLARVPTAHLFMAQAYARQQQWPRAESEARSSLAKAPANDNARGVLADALFRQKRYAEAIVEYRTYMSRRQRSPGAYTNLAIALTATGQLADAVAMFRYAADLEPGNASAWRNLAFALLDINKPEEALLAVRRALALNPDDAVARDLIATIEREGF